MANAHSAIGIHENTLTKRSKTGPLSAGTLVCFDTDTAYVKPCSGDDIPWGVAKTDAPEAEDFVSIQPLAATSQTARLRAHGAVKAGQWLCLAENGLVQALPSTSGTYKAVGFALTDGQANELIEAITQLPQTITVG